MHITLGNDSYQHRGIPLWSDKALGSRRKQTNWTAQLLCGSEPTRQSCAHCEDVEVRPSSSQESREWGWGGGEWLMTASPAELNLCGVPL